MKQLKKRRKKIKLQCQTEIQNWRLKLKCLFQRVAPISPKIPKMLAILVPLDNLSNLKNRFCYKEIFLRTCKTPIKKRIKTTALKLMKDANGMHIVNMEKLMTEIPRTILAPNLNESQAPKICVNA